MATRYYKRRSTGQWYEGTHSRRGRFRSSPEDAVRLIASGLRIPVDDVEIVEVADGESDPRTNTDLRDAPGPAVDPLEAPFTPAERKALRALLP